MNNDNQQAAFGAANDTAFGNMPNLETLTLTPVELWGLALELTAVIGASEDNAETAVARAFLTCSHLEHEVQGYLLGQLVADLGDPEKAARRADVSMMALRVRETERLLGRVRGIRDAITFPAGVFI